MVKTTSHNITGLRLSRRAFGLGLGAVAGAGLLGGPRRAWAHDLSGVTLRVADQTGATRAKFEAAGLLKDLPYSIEWSVHPAAVNLHEALKADAADIGSSAAAPMVSALAGGSRIKAVAAWDNGGGGTKLITPKGSTIKSLEDLRGKTVSPTTRGSIGHYLVLKALQKAGISPDELKLAFLNPTDAAAAFHAGDLDAWSIWGIFSARATGTQGAQVLLSGEGVIPGLGILSATQTSLQDAGKRAAIADFIARTEAGYVWSRANPEAWVAYYAAFTKQPADLVRSIHPEDANYQPVALDDKLLAELEETYATWKAAGVLSGDLDLTQVLHPELA